MGHKGFTYHFTHKRNGQVIAEWDAENDMPLEGQNYVLGAAFSGTAKITGWYAGLWAGAYVPTEAVTAATLQGLVTEVTDYSGNRPAFTPAIASGEATDAQEYTFTADATLNGAFVSSSAAKNGADGLLASIVRFAAPRTMYTGDVITCTNVVSL